MHRPQNPLRALRHPDYRLLWIGEVLRTSAGNMDLVTRALLIFQLTGSAAQVALVMAARSLPLFFVGIWGGLLADRVDRRRLLLSARTVTVASYVALAVLVYTGSIEVWMLYATAVVVGAGQALNGPARQSLLPSLVPRDELSSAVVLNTATLNIGQAIGPIIAGFAVSVAGIAPTYLLQAVILLAGGILIARMRFQDQVSRSHEPLMRSAAEGVRYLATRPLLLGLFSVVLTMTILIDPFRGVVPVIAVHNFAADAALTGILVGALGAGAVVSVALMAVFPSAGSTWRLVVFGAVGFGASVVCFAFAGNFTVAMVALFLAGFSQACFRTQGQTLQLVETADGFRGRVTSLWVTLRGTEPVGLVLLAGFTTLLGTDIAVGVMAGAGAVGIVAIAIIAELRRRSGGSEPQAAGVS